MQLVLPTCHAAPPSCPAISNAQPRPLQNDAIRILSWLSAAPRCIALQEQDRNRFLGIWGSWKARVKLPFETMGGVANHTNQ
jgi:hypothetical protein